MQAKEVERGLWYLRFLIHTSRDEDNTQWLLEIIVPSHELRKCILHDSLPPDAYVKKGDHHRVDALEECLHLTATFSVPEFSRRTSG